MREIEGVLPLELYVAVDIAPTDATTVVADATHMPFADGCAQYVVSFDVIQHIPDSMAVLSEVARVLRPGGLFVLAFPFNYCECDVVDFRRWTLAGMRRDLEVAGLTVLRIEQRGGRFFAFACALNWAVQHMVPGQRAGWRARRSAGAVLRGALQHAMTLPTMLLQWLMLALDALFPNHGSYMGGILVATRAQPCA
jgi:SAM-dependent methyltransferase